MKQITVSWGGDVVTVDLQPVAGSEPLVTGMLGKHVRITGDDGSWVVSVCNGPPEVLSMHAEGDTPQKAIDALSERMWKLAAWTRGVFAKPAQEKCPTCDTRIRLRRPDGRVRCRCGKTSVASPS